MALNRTHVSVGNTSTVMGLNWENEFKNSINNILDNAADLTQLAAMSVVSNNYFQGFLPKYSSDTIFAINPGVCRDSTNAVILSKSTVMNLDMTVGGVGGAIQSANLTGTVSTLINSTTVTGSGTNFLTTFIPGDVLVINGGLGRRVLSIQSATQLTLSSASSVSVTNGTYRRGGRAVDSYYYLYLVGDGTNTNCIMSTRNVANGQSIIDTGTYTFFRQTAFVMKTDSNGNLYRFMIGEGWPARPRHHYSNASVDAPYLFVPTVTTSWANFSVASLVPPVARIAGIDTFPGAASGTSTTLYYVREPNTNIANGRLIASINGNGSGVNSIPYIGLDANQTFDMRSNNTVQALLFSLTSYVVTEVPV